MPINLNESWQKGHLHDPRPYKDFSQLNREFSVLYKIGVAGFVVNIVLSMFLTGSTVLPLVGMLFFLPVLFTVVISFDRQQKNTEAIRAAGIRETEVFFLKGEVPDEARTKLVLAQTSGLFDNVMVAAPREAFERVITGDPVIFGEADGQTYLVAAWDLGSDLGREN
jgi:hypothetical protein